MNHERALLERVLASPDDESARLAYATWCDSKGDPRGACIRLQLELSGIDRADRERRGPLLRRQQTLISRHGATWAGAIADVVDDYRFHRGLVEHVMMDAATFLAQARDLYALAPIRHVDLKDARPVFSQLAASALLAPLRSLSFARDGIGDDEVVMLAASPNLPRLRYLDLSYNPKIGERGIEQLIRSPLRDQLQFVGRWGNPYHPTPAVETDWDGSIYDVIDSPLAAQLEARFGVVPWLHADADDYPPSRY